MSIEKRKIFFYKTDKKTKSAQDADFVEKTDLKN